MRYKAASDEKLREWDEKFNVEKLRKEVKEIELLEKAQKSKNKYDLEDNLKSIDGKVD